MTSAHASRRVRFRSRFGDCRPADARPSSLLRRTAVVSWRSYYLVCISLSSVRATTNGADLQTRMPCNFKPLCSDDFSLRTWGRRTSIFETNCTSAEALLDERDVADLLRADYGSFNVFGGTASDDTTTLVSPQPHKVRGKITDFYTNSTLVVTSLERKVPTVAKWARSFMQAFGLPCEVTLYLTPQGSQALSVHNDPGDTLVMQLWGHEIWDVWDLSAIGASGSGLPKKFDGLNPPLSPFQAHVISAASDGLGQTDTVNETDHKLTTMPTVKAHLRPGSMLYIPRGSFHVASTAGLLDGTSARLELSLPTQTFSFASAAYHMAAQPDFKEPLRDAGWSVARFKQALMRAADHAQHGADLRGSLPLAWVWKELGVAGGPCTVAVTDADSGLGTQQRDDLEATRSALESFMYRVLQESLPLPKRQAVVDASGDATAASLFPSHSSQPPAAPSPPRSKLHVSANVSRGVASALSRHLKSVDKLLAPVRTLNGIGITSDDASVGTTAAGASNPSVASSATNTENAQQVVLVEPILELPSGLHIAYVAWGVDDYGGGEVLVRFSWCGSGAEGAVKARWPAAVLPMVRDLSSSRSRFIRITQVGSSFAGRGDFASGVYRGDKGRPQDRDNASSGVTTTQHVLQDVSRDNMPALLFAIELERLPLQPKIRLFSEAPPSVAEEALAATEMAFTVAGIEMGMSFSPSRSQDFTRDPDCRGSSHS
eukprot:TRINITY_DN33337_c0_g1_i1.p1 TRINITY_DN33337_c0_g1~~TRINITY_DN33337_c0_g1_i1.p1  ORF type:complete len:716 (-),score=97.78 TRINITY_DN33337_c0_g1_i1:74-2221(-)